MSNDFEKEKINIDDLVDFLVKRRDENAAAAPVVSSPVVDEEETMPAIMPEPVVSVPAKEPVANAPV